jgi:hypothetical protein
MFFINGKHAAILGGRKAEISRLYFENAKRLRGELEMDPTFGWAMVQRELIRLNSRFQRNPGQERRSRKGALGAIWDWLER